MLILQMLRPLSRALDLVLSGVKMASAVAIQGDLDDKVINTTQAKEAILEPDLANDVASKGLRYRFDGRDQEQGEAFADMSTGGTLALICIYVILAWVFCCTSICCDDYDTIWFDWRGGGSLCDGPINEYSIHVRTGGFVGDCGE